MEFELIKCDTNNTFTLDITRESIYGAERTISLILNALNVFEHVSINKYSLYCEFISQDSYEEEYKRISEILSIISQLLILA